MTLPDRQSIPKYLKGKIRVYKPLCPHWSLVSASKNGEITESQYEEEYISAILNNLNPEPLKYLSFEIVSELVNNLYHGYKSIVTLYQKI